MFEPAGTFRRNLVCACSLFCHVSAAVEPETAVGRSGRAVAASILKVELVDMRVAAVRARFLTPLGEFRVLQAWSIFGCQSEPTGAALPE